jgi:hypothetical protein
MEKEEEYKIDYERFDLILGSNQNEERKRR